MKYRKDIDGLRAIAVVPVILCHAGIPGFAGGFYGVDVFFVISGFLITTILHTDFALKRYSLVLFYERRIRRIWPALFVVLVATTVASYFWMLPDEFKNFGQSLVATTLFSNNILLTVTSGYWSLASEYKPLLHTWSLGVEEQFYILFPLILFICHRYARRYLTSILCFFLLSSFIVALLEQPQHPDSTFYLLPTRAWELMIGAIAAILCADGSPLIKSRRIAGALAISGLALILLVVTLLDSGARDPGWWSLLPTLGTTLIILYSRPDNAAYQILSTKVLVSIGIISYSAYLWHWPLLSLAKVYSATPVPLWFNAALALLSLGLAYLSWRFIESPFRNAQLVSRRSIFALSGSTAIVVVIAGYMLHKTYGLPSRWDATQSFVVQEVDKNLYNSRVYAFKKDRFESGVPVKLLVVGDSFARDFVNMVTETFDLKRVEIVYRDDFTECLVQLPEAQVKLLEQANLIVFASGRYRSSCVNHDIDFAEKEAKTLIFVGSKHFGSNLNWTIRVDDRRSLYNGLLSRTISEESSFQEMIPERYRISLLEKVRVNDAVPISDKFGRLLSTDRNHLTKYGAQFFGEAVLKNGIFETALEPR